MKTKNLLLLGLGGVAIYMYMRNKKSKGVVDATSPDVTLPEETIPESNVIQGVFVGGVPSQGVSQGVPIVTGGIKPSRIKVRPTPIDCHILGTCTVGIKSFHPIKMYSNLAKYNGQYVIGTYPNGRTFGGVLNTDSKKIMSQAKGGGVGESANIYEFKSIVLQDGTSILGGAIQNITASIKSIFTPTLQSV